MFITVYGKYGPQPPKNHVINTNLIQKIQTYQPLFGKEKYYDIWVQTDGYGPPICLPGIKIGGKEAL